MRHGVLVSVAVLAMVSGCDRSPLPGASKIGDDVYWRLNMLGEGERTPTDSDSVSVRVRISRPEADAGSMFSTERWYAMGKGRPTTMFFGRMRQGDSATILLPSRITPWAALGATEPAAAKDTGWVRMELSLRGIRSLEDSRDMLQVLRMSRTKADEDSILTDFLATSKAPWKQAMDVYYELDLSAGQGPRIQSGELVTLAYTASFLDNGKVFDEQREADGGLTFRLGDPGQVIKGLEVAAHLLPRNGGRGRFIIPSELAFGPNGSSSGIVPPWTPLLYEVEVLSPSSAEADAAR